MARVPVLEKDQISGDLRKTFERMEEKEVRILNIFKVMANCPVIGRDFLRLGNSLLFKGSLDSRLRELVILRVGDLAKATYEWTQHVAVARRVGVPDAQIESLPDWQNSDQFSDEEKAILQYTDETAQKIRVSDNTFGRVKAFLSNEQIVELTTVIGYYGAVSRILEALEVELEREPEE